MRIKHWRVLVLVVVIGGVAALGGFTYISNQEHDNRFCISCHTQPESDYYARFQSAVATQTAEDLAAFHHRKKDIACIDCHGGEGIVGRVQVEAYAARNAILHYTNTARQPAVILLPIQNEACLKCHDAEMRKPGFENHFHNKQFLSQDPVPFIRCTDCHIAHRQGDEQTVFQFRTAILPKCEYCHTTVGKGPRGLSQ